MNEWEHYFFKLLTLALQFIFIFLTFLRLEWLKSLMTLNITVTPNYYQSKQLRIGKHYFET